MTLTHQTKTTGKIPKSPVITNARQNDTSVKNVSANPLTRHLGNQMTGYLLSRSTDHDNRQTGNKNVIDKLGSGRALSIGLRNYFEPRFGKDLSEVRIHTGREASVATQKMHASAFTIGNNIAFNTDDYQPDTYSGRHLLAHELAHTIQQGNASGVVQPRLKISASGDPSEREADKAADSVMRGAPVGKLTGVPNTIQRREALSTRPSGENQVVIVMDDGQEYRVTHYRAPVTLRTPEYLPPEVTPDIGLNDITIRIEWCRDTRGNVTLGANIPEQARGVAQEIVGVIRRGGSSRDVGRVLEDTDITPFINFVVSTPGGLEIFGGVRLTVGREGITSGSGRVGVRAESGTSVFVEGRGNEEGGQLTLNVEQKFGERSQDPCPTREATTETYRNYYSCERLNPARTEQRTRQVQRTDTQTHYIYFEHARSRILGRAGGGGGGSGVAGRNATSMATILDQLANGYRLSRVQAYASPEGLRARRPGGRFIGNDQLARNRAQAALDWVNANCATAGASMQCPQTPQLSTIPPQESELYSPPDIEGQEQTGTPVEESAVQHFLTEEDETRHRTDVLVDQINRGRTPQQRAQLVYPLLRRAELAMERTRTVAETYQHEIPVTYTGTRCPQDVVNAAANYFRRRR